MVLGLRYKNTQAFVFISAPEIAQRDTAGYLVRESRPEACKDSAPTCGPPLSEPEIAVYVPWVTAEERSAVPAAGRRCAARCCPPVPLSVVLQRDRRRAAEPSAP